jgi:aspartyl protease family protein
VALSRDEAQRMSIDLAGAQRVQIATAGGPKYCYQVNLASVSVGAVALNNVAAVVMESSREELPITLIGMSFLNGVDMQRSGDTLTLSRRQF